MSIQVNDFRWEPGKNDAEYIKLLESSRDVWQKLAQKAIAKLKTLPKAQEAQGWVSVKDRLPEGRTNPHTLDFEPVLCATVFGDIRVYKYGQRLGQTEAHFYHGYSWMDDYVTHWMPLPEPPKEDEA